MKVVIVITHLNRQYQLKRTLNSFRNTKHTDYEVVIIDDGSVEELQLDFDSYPFPINIYKMEDKKWINMVPAYNKGFGKALELNPELILIQNAECIHVGDVISYAVMNIRFNEYLAFGCYSLDKETTFKEDYDIFEIIRQHNRRTRVSGQRGWYTHPTFRPQGFHFCAAIFTENLKRLNGFDERFSNGFAFDDVYLLHQIKNLGLKIRITAPPAPFVIHQWHYDGLEKPEDIRLVAVNEALWRSLRQNKEYKALHLYTKDL
jgi:glycosyltransferase involved in cell wall biosynthesis